MSPFETAAAALGVVPVIAIRSAECALRRADALLEGGLPLAETAVRATVAAVGSTWIAPQEAVRERRWAQITANAAAAVRRAAEVRGTGR